LLRSVITVITLTRTCSNSDLSTMSASRSDRSTRESEVVRQLLQGIQDLDPELRKKDAATDSDSDSGDDSEEPEDDDVRKLREERGKRKKALEDLATQYLEDNKRSKPTVTVERKVTRVEDLPLVNQLSLDKQISMMNFLRDVIFPGLKYVTKDTIERGTVSKKMMANLQLASDFQKRTYQLHLELALKKKIGQFRNNSIKNMKWKYRVDQGKGEGKRTCASLRMRVEAVHL
jgi:hypothetical protein